MTANPKKAAPPCVALMLALAVFPAAGAPAPRPITLDQAVELAERNAPSVIQAQGQKRVSDSGVRSAYAAFIPSLSVSAGATRQLPSSGGVNRILNGQIVTLPDQPWSSSIGLGASVDLFDGGQRFFNVRQAKARVMVAEANQVTQRYTAALNAKQQYYNVLAARESESAARAQLEQAEQQRRTAVARTKARNATRSDSLRAEIQVRTAQLAISDAQTALVSAEASLTRAVGADGPVTAAAADTLEPAVLAVDDSTLRMLAANGPLVQQNVASLDAARAARRSAWTNYLPAVTASYSRSGNGISSGFGFQTDAYDYAGSLRLALTFPLFNQLQRESQITAAQVAEVDAQADLRDARLAADESVTQSLGAFHSAGERIASQIATLEAAEEDLRVQQQRYSVGGSVLLDVLTSQTQLDQARRDLIRARYDQRVAKATLEALVGREL